MREIDRKGFALSPFPWGLVMIWIALASCVVTAFALASCKSDAGCVADVIFGNDADKAKCAPSQSPPSQ